MGFDFFSPGCNCKAIFTNTGPCSGVITWCTKPNATVIVQKKTGGTWNDVAVVLPTDPQAYPVNNSQTGTYRIKCVLCNNQASTSDEINPQFCGNHSFWFRLARQNCTLFNPIICPDLPARWKLKTLVVSGVPRRVPACYNCLGVEIFPDFSLSNYVYTMVQVVSPTYWKLYSISYTASNMTRNGYTFDFRYLNQTNYPNCGSSGSWFLYFFSQSGYGLYNLGTVTFTRNEAFTWELIGEKAGASASWWLDPTTPEGGNWNETLVQQADIKVWYNPYGTGNAAVGYTGPGVSWDDASYMGGADQSGNSLGVYYNNPVIQRTYSGTLPSSFDPNWRAFGPDSTALQNPWPARRYGSEPLTEFKVRSCNEYNNGTNPLPPGTVRNCPWDGGPWLGTGAWLP